MFRLFVAASLFLLSSKASAAWEEGIWEYFIFESTGRFVGASKSCHGDKAFRGYAYRCCHFGNTSWIEEEGDLSLQDLYFTSEGYSIPPGTKLDTSDRHFQFFISGAPKAVAVFDGSPLVLDRIVTNAGPLPNWSWTVPVAEEPKSICTLYR